MTRYKGRQNAKVISFIRTCDERRAIPIHVPIPAGITTRPPKVIGWRSPLKARLRATATSRTPVTGGKLLYALIWQRQL